MPEIGEIKQRRALFKGKNNGYMKYIWQACPDCEKFRWIRVGKEGKPRTPRCYPCAQKLRSGDKAYNWKGGRTKHNGYTLVSLSKDDFFYSMANKSGYVYEHRLVVAKALGRCLQSWEKVHHKNSRRDDNRYPENLTLVLLGRHLGEIKCPYCHKGFSIY